MASHWHNSGKHRVWTEDMTANNAIHMQLLMDQTIEAGEADHAAALDAATINDFTSAIANLDEYDGGANSGGDIYSTTVAALGTTNTDLIGITLYQVGHATRTTQPTTTLDATSDQGEFTGENFNFTGMSNGSFAIQGAFLTIAPVPGTSAFSAYWPWLYIDTGGFPVNPAGGDLQINWSSTDGIAFIA